MKVNRSTVCLSVLSACLLANSGMATAAVPSTANFTAVVTAHVPSDFIFVTKEGNKDNISINFPSTEFDKDMHIFNDHFENVKIQGSGVNPETEITVTADNLTLTSPDNNKASMLVMFNSTADVPDDSMILHDKTESVKLTKDNIANFGDFFVGYNLSGQDVNQGDYTGTIILTAAADL